MGLSQPSFFAVDPPTLMRKQENRVVYSISASHFYNFYQESVLHPRRYMFYDARPKAAYVEASIQNAVWAWEGNRPDGGGGADGSSNAYLQLLKKEASGRTVVVFSDRKHVGHASTFLHRLFLSGAETRLNCVLKVGIETIAQGRYYTLMSNTQGAAEGPIEVVWGLLDDVCSQVLAPRRPKSTRCPSVFITGVDLLAAQMASIIRFHIGAIVNVSSSAIGHPPGTIVDVFSTKFGVPDLMKVAQAIKRHTVSRRTVLVVDDMQGREYAAASCVVFLVLEGIPIGTAIQFVKEKKPSADMNHLMAVHSVVGETPPKRTRQSKCFMRYYSCGDTIPAEYLDKWDDEDGAVEEIVENTLLCQGEVGSRLEVPTKDSDNGDSLKKSESSNSRRLIHFQMKAPRLNPSPVATSGRDTTNRFSKDRELLNDTSDSHQAESDRSFARHSREKTQRSPRPSSTGEVCRVPRRSRGVKDVKKSFVANGDSSHQVSEDTILDSAPLNLNDSEKEKDHEGKKIATGSVGRGEDVKRGQIVQKRDAEESSDSWKNFNKRFSLPEDNTTTGNYSSGMVDHRFDGEDEALFSGGNEEENVRLALPSLEAGNEVEEEAYEYTEVDPTADIQVGVMYQDEEGNCYYYEPVDPEFGETASAGYHEEARSSGAGSDIGDRIEKNGKREYIPASSLEFYDLDDEDDLITPVETHHFS